MEIFISYIYPIIVGLIIGIFASIYASMICSKILIFNSIKSKCKEVLFLNSGPFTSSVDVKNSIKNFEYYDYVADNLNLLGHFYASNEILELKSKIIYNLNDISSDFYYSEVRRKNNVSETSISEFQNYYNYIDHLKANKKVFLKLNFIS